MRSSCHRPNIPSWQESAGAGWPNFSHPPPFSTTLPLSQFTYLYHWTWSTWHFACSPTQACPRGANACNTDGGISSSPQPPKSAAKNPWGRARMGWWELLKGHLSIPLGPAALELHRNSLWSQCFWLKHGPRR